MRKLDEILDRQRRTTTRDIVFGLLAAFVVVFQVIAFSSSEPLPTPTAPATGIEEAQQVNLLDEVKRHTAVKCGEHERALDDLAC